MRIQRYGPSLPLSRDRDFLKELASRLVACRLVFGQPRQEDQLGFLERIAVFEYIEGWYNPHRRHSSVGQMSPVNFERKHQLAQAA